MAARVTLNVFIDRWIIDYRCRELWNNFEKTGFVSLDSCNLALFTSSLANVDQHSTEGDDTYPRSALLVDLMCKLSYGRTTPKHYTKKLKTSTALDLTTLEEGVEVLNRLENETNLNNFVSDVDMARFRLSIKRQAVYVCCRAGNFKLASAVFDRQFVQWLGDVDAMNEVAAVLLEKNIDHPKFTTESYDALIHDGCSFLRMIICQLPIPFLTLAAQNAQKQIVQKQIPTENSGVRVSIIDTPSDASRSSRVPETKTKSKLKKNKVVAVNGNNATPLTLSNNTRSPDTDLPSSFSTKTEQNVLKILTKQSNTKSGVSKYIVQDKTVLDKTSVDRSTTERLEISESTGAMKCDVRPLMLFSHADIVKNKPIDLLDTHPDTILSTGSLALSKLKSDKSKVTGNSEESEIPKINQVESRKYSRNLTRIGTRRKEREKSSNERSRRRTVAETTNLSNVNLTSSPASASLVRTRKTKSLEAPKILSTSSEEFKRLKITHLRNNDCRSKSRSLSNGAPLSSIASPTQAKLSDKNSQLRKRKTIDPVVVLNRPTSLEMAAARSSETSPDTDDAQKASKRLKRLPKRFQDGYLLDSLE